MSIRRRRLSGSGAVGLIGERGVLTDFATFTRASSATLLTDATTLAEVADNIPRFSYTSVYGGRRYLHEGARTNGIRNNTMDGATAGVIGSGGAYPTDWTQVNNASFVPEIIGSFTSNGVEYIRVNLTGTPTGAGVYQISFESLTQIVAASGQSWSNSCYLAISGGDLTNITSITLRSNEYTSGGAFVAGNASSDLKAGLTSSLVRKEYNVALAGGGTVARVVPLLDIRATSAPINITLDIGLPQMEQGAFASSVIKTSGSAVTRAIDVNTIGISSAPWFSTSRGSVRARFAGNDVSGNHTIFQMDDGTNNNRIALEWQSGGNRLALVCQVSGVLVANFGSFVWDGSAVDVTVSWEQDNFAIQVNGGAIETDTTGNLPSGLTTFRIGGRSSGNALDGYIESLVYFPYHLLDS